MSTSTDPPYPSENTYAIDPNDAAEMVRLLHQAYLLTHYLGGLFPEQPNFSNIHDVLDIACGPGGWAIQVAQTYPDIEVMGIDLSINMIMYARAQALIHSLPNAHFRLMDALKPLDFADQSFDLVNARFLFAFMPPAVWPKLLQECMRILRPGGIIRLTECEFPITNSTACERINGLTIRAFQVTGRSFSPDGQHLGITPMLACFLRGVGYCNIQRMAHVLDFSAGTAAHKGSYQDYMVAYKLVQPFLMKSGVITQEAFDQLYQRALREILADDFCGIQFFLTVWGERP